MDGEIIFSLKFFCIFLKLVTTLAYTCCIYRSHLLLVIIRAHNVPPLLSVVLKKNYSSLSSLNPQGLLTGVGLARRPAFSSLEALEECE